MIRGVDARAKDQVIIAVCGGVGESHHHSFRCVMANEAVDLKENAFDLPSDKAGSETCER